jgi:hypothetical protein
LISRSRSQTRSAGDRIEADRRLVEKKDLGFVQHRLGELEASDHAAGVGPHQRVTGPLDLHERQRGVDARHAFPARDAIESRGEHQVLPTGQRTVGGE